MNDIGKIAASAKLAEAVIKTGIAKAEASRLLGLSNKVYANMIINAKENAKCGNKPWQIVQHWVNSGLSLAQYADKYIIHPSGKNKAFLTDEEKEMLDAGVLIPAAFGKHADDVTDTPEEEPAPETTKAPGSEGHKTATTLPGESLNIKEGQPATIEEIKELMTSGKIILRSEEISTSLEETKPVDRLETVLQVINELKEMGFDIDIHISPKQ